MASDEIARRGAVPPRPARPSWLSAPVESLRALLRTRRKRSVAGRLAAIEAELRRLAETPNRVVPLGDRLLALTHSGRKIFLDPADIGITPHIALSGTWERETEIVVRRLLRPGDVAIEVGANMGYHTLAMAEAVGPEGHVHSFEANPPIARLLHATIQVNGFADRVTLHAKAALAAYGEVEFAVHPDHCGSAHLAVPQDQPMYSGRARVAGVPLDAEPGAALARLDMIRMDAEGSEPLVLRGATRLLARHPGLVLVTEWAPMLMQAYGDVAGFADWLAGLGFRASRILPDATLQPMDRAALLEAGHIEVVFQRAS